MSPLLLILLLLQACSPSANSQTEVPQSDMDESSASPQAVFIGTYTRDEGFVNGQSDGIQLAWLDPQTGAFSNASTAAKLINPSWVVRHPNGKVLYAVSELAHADEPTGFLHSFAISEDQSLKPVSKIETVGQAPCHISVDQSGRYVFVANYVGGIVKMYQTSETGELTPSDEVAFDSAPLAHPRQEASHTHMASISPDNKFLYVPDLGANKVWCFVIDHENGKLKPAEVPFTEVQIAAGPRHMRFHPNGTFAYLINELDASVNLYHYDQTTGALQFQQTKSSLPEGYDQVKSCAALRVHPSGKFLYGSNRGHDSIVIFSIDEETGELTLVGFEATLGKAPRAFNISQDGRFLFAANQDSGNIITFQIDMRTGKLSRQSEFELATPVCLDL